MKKISKADGQLDVDALCECDRNKRKIDGLGYRDLFEHLAEILSWANATRTSKRKVARLVKQKFDLEVSAHRIYRFVKKYNDGVWPHHRAKKGEKS